MELLERAINLSFCYSIWRFRTTAGSNGSNLFLMEFMLSWSDFILFLFLLEISLDKDKRFLLELLSFRDLDCSLTWSILVEILLLTFLIRSWYILCLQRQCQQKIPDSNCSFKAAIFYQSLYNIILEMKLRFS